MPNDLKVLDLFCGCGGLSYGFSQAGFKIAAGVDLSPIFLKTYSHNIIDVKTYEADISKLNLSKNEISSLKIDVILGGPPCQGFSIAGKRNHDDKRNFLISDLFRYIEVFEPMAFVIENVPTILTNNNKYHINSFIDICSRYGYYIEYKILKSHEYGVPQIRRRAFFVGMKKRKFEFPFKIYTSDEQFITVKDAISDLPENSVEDGEQYLLGPTSKYQEIMRDSSDGIYNHKIVKHEQKTIDVISHVPDGGNYKDLPNYLQGIRNVNIAWTRLNSIKPSYTIDTGHRHHFHYQYNRVPTVRESARIQSFPDKFHFIGTKSQQEIQVGNAVPPLLANKIAENLLKFL